MSTTPENVPIAAIVAALRVAAMGGRELWGYDEIAAYSKHERNYIVNTIVHQPGFPRAIRAINERSHPRYVANEVMTWFESRR